MRSARTWLHPRALQGLPPGETRGLQLQRRGFCPSCGARRMVEAAALLVDEVLPAVPMRQWVLSVPYPLGFLFASDPVSMSECLGIVYRAIAAFQIKESPAHAAAQCGAITLSQRFGSALNPTAGTGLQLRGLVRHGGQNSDALNEVAGLG